MTPATKYATSGGVSIAHQVLGDGPLDVVLVPGWVLNLDAFWEEPAVEQFFRRVPGDWHLFAVAQEARSESQRAR